MKHSNTRKSKSKKLAIILLSVIFVVSLVTTIFVIRGSDSFWLDRFHNSLTIDKTQSKQEIVKKIEIYEGDKLAIEYKQSYKVDLSGNTPYATLIIQETYLLLDTTEYNLLDEYILQDNKMNIKRVYGDNEVANITINSDIDVFWQIVSENASLNIYNIKFVNDVKINRGNKSLLASVNDNKANDFFVDNIAEKRANIDVNIQLDDKFRLKDMVVSYDIITDNQVARAIVSVNAIQTAKGNTLITGIGIVMIIIDIIIFIAIITIIVVSLSKKHKYRNSTHNKYNAPDAINTNNIPPQTYNQPYQQTNIRHKSSNTQNQNPNQTYSQYSQTNMYPNSQNQQQVRNIKDNAHNKSNKRNK